MSELKTRPTDQSVAAFIDAVEPEQKRADCWTLVEIMRKVTGAEPVMWGPSIVGFGAYTYVNCEFTQRMGGGNQRLPQCTQQFGSATTSP